MIAIKAKTAHFLAMFALAVLLELALPMTPANACTYSDCPPHDERSAAAHAERANRYAYEMSQLPQTSGQSGPTFPTRPPPPKPASYVTVWWHPDANDVWAVWNHDHLYDAGFAAYSACTRLMGDGCDLLVEGSNTSVVVARDQHGGQVFGKGKSPEEARALLTQYCTEKKIVCETTHEFTAKLPKKGRPVAEAFFPGSSAITDRSKFRFTAGYGYNMFHIRERIWLVSGYPSAAAAKRTGDDLCFQTKGCSSYDGAIFEIDSGYALIFKNKYGDGFFMDYLVGADKVDLAKKAMAECRKRSGTGCTEGLFVDPRVPYKGEISLAMLQPWSKLHQAAGTLASNQSNVPTGPTGTGAGSGMSYTSKPSPGGGAFTAQAQVKGVDNIWKFMIWSVSGGVDGPATSAAALAECRKDSQMECEIWSESNDTKIALYTDDQHTVRLGKVRYAVDPVPLVKQACKSDKTTCRIVRVIDSRAPLMERIEVR